MGSRQLFCLRWSNHQTNMLNVFDELLQSEALVDVTIACEGLSIKAHKVVLSACSPYFQNLFVQNPCKHPIVILKDIKYSELKALVDFMYKGEVNVTQEQLNALLKTAESLKIKGLAEVTGGLNGQNDSGDHLPPAVAPLQQQQQQQQQQHQLRSHLLSVPQRRNLPTGPAATSEAPPEPSTATDPGPTAASSGVDLSPPHKRRKVRHRRRSADKGCESDGGGDGAAEDSAPDLIEPKVEVAEEGFDSGPGRPPDGDPEDRDPDVDAHRPCDAASESVHDTSSQCSFRSQELGPPSVRSDDTGPSVRLKAFGFGSPLSLGAGGASTSTSGEGSSQGFAEPKDPPIVCWECGIKFRHRASLSRHQRTLHRERHVRYPCKVCGRTFKRSDNMKFHVQLKHNGGTGGGAATAQQGNRVNWAEDEDFEEDDDVTIISETVAT